MNGFEPRTSGVGSDRLPTEPQPLLKIWQNFEPDLQLILLLGKYLLFKKAKY